MDRDAIKNFIYGGVEELLQDKKFYYHSGIGAGYSHLTDAGKAAVVEFVEIVGWKIREAREEDLNNRAKQQVLDSLKGKE
jgi:hypothetical protein